MVSCFALVLIKKLSNLIFYIKFTKLTNFFRYNPDFRFYMTTKLSNPKYKAEVSTRVTLVNFAVKEEGLQDQLISVVI